MNTKQTPAIARTPEIDALLARNAPVAIGISGGKDSSAVSFAVVDYLNEIGHTGPRILIHSHLGRTEWADSLPTCTRLAEATKTELVVVKRKAGDMMARWETRWANNVARYRNLECVQIILPWSTPTMRFCTSELKTDVICGELKRRFPGGTILSVSGIRRDESKQRSKAKIVKRQKKLTDKKRGTIGLDWNAICTWSVEDVLACCAQHDFVMHEAYRVYGSTRVSCKFCIMSSGPDLLAAAGCDDNQDHYRELVALEVRSSFAFQGNKWLGDVAPHLLSDVMRKGVAQAKRLADQRKAAEARIPKHLLYTAGWPTCIPTPVEAKLLAEVRTQVVELLDIEGAKYLDADSIIVRYHQLMDIKREKDAAKAKRKAKQAR